MKSLSKFLMVVSAVSCGCMSCKPDPQLVEKREQQKVEITRLQGEITLMEEKLKHMPPDVSNELAEAKEQASKQNEEIERLDAEVTELQSKKLALQKEYDQYRAKYQVK
jgi:septal ring factor EnvC (AmiA/AmiB activator)